jgi:peptidoglycan/LPS O-acetylase OafA/YrhL
MATIHTVEPPVHESIPPTKVSSPPANTYDSTKYITGLRAYSALAVFLIHSGGAGLRQLSVFTDNVVDNGRYGVISFFVISAYTIYMSIDSSKKFSFNKYFIRRFLRIVPLYFIVGGVCFFLGGDSYYLQYFRVQNDFNNLIYHLTFLNLIDIQYRNSLIGVEWAIPLEFFYYLLFPVMFIFLRKKPFRIVILVAVSFFISFYSKQLFDFWYFPLDKDLANQWSLEKYAFTFTIGVLAYLVVKNLGPFRFNSLHLLILLAVLFLFINVRLFNFWIFLSVWVAVLLIFLPSRSVLGRVLFENRIIMYLGKISFSIYLVHFPILSLLPKSIGLQMVFLIALTTTILIASIAYYLIEEPFINLGKKILTSI